MDQDLTVLSAWDRAENKARTITILWKLQSSERGKYFSNNCLITTVINVECNKNIVCRTGFIKEVRVFVLFAIPEKLFPLSFV